MQTVAVSFKGTAFGFLQRRESCADKVYILLLPAAFYDVAQFEKAFFQMFPISEAYFLPDFIEFVQCVIHWLCSGKFQREQRDSDKYQEKCQRFEFDAFVVKEP